MRLVITPTVLGQGRRLFPDHGRALGMRVSDHTTTPGGLTILGLEASGPAAVATYDGVTSVHDTR